MDPILRTYALYMVGPSHWDHWQARIDRAIVRKQRRDGHFNGSWDPNGVWGKDGGRIYSTAIVAMTLAAYYRRTYLLR